MGVEVNKIIYSMVGVSKFYNNKPILKDIYLSYFYGAKIGVIGLNGSGKSSLLKILAGVDKNINGETVVSPEFTIGFLEQEPQLDDTKTVKEIVQEGVQSVVDLHQDGLLAHQVKVCLVFEAAICRVRLVFFLRRKEFYTMYQMVDNAKHPLPFQVVNLNPIRPLLRVFPELHLVAQGVLSFHHRP